MRKGYTKREKSVNMQTNEKWRVQERQFFVKIFAKMPT